MNFTFCGVIIDVNCSSPLYTICLIVDTRVKWSYGELTAAHALNSCSFLLSALLCAQKWPEVRHGRIQLCFVSKFLLIFAAFSEDAEQLY